MKRIVMMLGAGPQFVKAAVSSRSFIDRHEILVRIGRHFGKDVPVCLFGTSS